MRFARFLVDRGQISIQQALGALDRQRRATPPFGRVALLHGLLTEEQVFDVLDEQDANPAPYRSFGDIVVARGWLAADDLHLLARSQRVSRPPIGQFLIRMGAIREPDLEQFLDAFGSARRGGRQTRCPPWGQ